MKQKLYSLLLFMAMLCMGENKTMAVERLLDAKSLHFFLDAIEYTCEMNKKPFTLRFEYQYDTSNIKKSNVGVNEGEIYLYEDALDKYVVAPYNEGDIIKVPEDIACLFMDLKQLYSITFNNFNTSGVKTMYQMFYGCTNLTSVNFGNIDMSNVRNMYQMFRDCPNLTSFTIGNIDISPVWNYQEMSVDCDKLNTLTMTSVPYLCSGFCDPFTTVNVVLDDNSVVDERNNSLSTATTASYTRTMTNEWGTITLPFSVAYKSNNGNYKLYEISGREGNDLKLTETKKATCNAGDPYVIRAVGDQNTTTGKYTVTISNQNATLATQANTAEYKDINGYDYTLRGTFKQKPSQTGVYYIAQNKFWYAEDPITVDPFRAWIEVAEAGTTESAPTRSFNLVVDDDETNGITAIRNDEADAIRSFDLMGRQTTSTHRGLQIRDGKKIVVLQ